MPRSTEPRGLVVASLVALAFVHASDASAQVVFDDTFGQPGAAPTVVGPSGTTIEIEQARGGTVTSGGRSHLLHSFSEFGVPATQTAEFRTDDTIDTILARVTGANASSIDGVLRVRNTSGVGGPDLFLLNPNGVLFGGNARLDLDGAFYGTTAGWVALADGARFSAIDTAAALPATAAEPVALGFAATGSGDVELGGRLSSNAPPGSGRQAASHVVLVGRDIRTTGSGFIAAQGATVGLVAVGPDAITVPVDVTAIDGAALRGTIRIGEPGVPVSVQTSSPGADQGRIVIRGGALVLRDGGLFAGGEAGAPPDALAIDVEVADRVTIEGSESKIESLAGGTLGPGGVRLIARELEILDGGSLGITHNGTGATPATLAVDADRVRLDGSASVIRSVTTRGGPGADIEIRAGTLALANEAAIVAESTDNGALQDGEVGAIRIDADTIVLETGADVASITRGDGRGGDILVEGGTLRLSSRSRIQAGSRTDAASGDVRIEVDEAQLLDSAFVGTGFLGDVSEIGLGESLSGPAGDVEVVADQLTIEGGSQIASTTIGAGDAGDVTLRIAGTLRASGRLEGTNQVSGVFARSGLQFGSTASGDGGTIATYAARLELADGAQISVQSAGSGDAGGIDLRVASDARLDGGVISASSTGTGATGVVHVETGRDLLLSRGATIRSNVQTPTPALPTDPPTAGDVELVVGRDLRVVDSTIATDTTRLESGNVRIEVGQAMAVVDGGITTNIDTLSGQGGDVLVTTGVLAVGRSAITANADGANSAAGNVLVVAEGGLVRTPTSVITARASPAGVSGRVVLAGPDTNLAGELAALAIAYRDDRESLRDPCEAKRSRAGSFERRPRAQGVWTPDAAPGVWPAESERGDDAPATSDAASGADEGRAARTDGDGCPIP